MKRCLSKITLLCVFLLVFTGLASSLSIIIDDKSEGYSDSGSWKSFSNSCGYNNSYRYETDSLENNTALWMPVINIKGNYSVYTHYCVHSARPIQVPFLVKHASGQETVLVDQTKNSSNDFSGNFVSSGWKLLGTYPFNSSGNQFVSLNSSSAGDTVADAILFELVYSCNVSLVNTTKGAWINQGLCLSNNTQMQSRSWIEYDLNNCGDFNNITYEEYQEEVCDFCTPNMTYTNWSEWFNFVCSGIQMNQSQTRVKYDQNSCGEIDNVTEYNYQLVGPTLINTSWSYWENITECLPQGHYTQERRKTEFDEYECKGNVTLLEYQNIACEYDSIPPVINKTIPKEGWVLSNKKINISAEIYDQEGNKSDINITSISLTLNEVKIPFNLSLNIVNSSLNNVSFNKSIYNVNWGGELDEGVYIVNLKVSDNNKNVHEVNWSFSINFDAGNFNVISPEEGKVYSSQAINTRIVSEYTLSRLEYDYIIPSNNPWVQPFIICERCMGGEKQIYFREGENKINFTSRDLYGNIKHQNVSFFVDSEKPRILSYSPKKNSIINSSIFSLYYTENNLRNISLFILNGNNLTVSTKNDCTSGTNRECFFENINLQEFDGKEITYWFSLDDIINSVNSTKIKIKVDITSPKVELSSPSNGEVYKKYAPFKFSASEKVTVKSINQETGERRTLVYDQSNYNKLRYFRTGKYSLNIIATDKAGNSYSKDLQFVVA